MSDNTPPQDATPGEGSVRREGMLTLTDAERKAVAWAVAIGNEGLVLDGIFLRKSDADEAYAWRNEHTAYGARLIPLYRQPQPTLTDEEREAVRFCVTAALPETEKLDGVAGELCRMHAATLRSLLDRLG